MRVLPLLLTDCDEHYFLITAEKCASCNLGVKESEMVRVQGKVYHHHCLSCCHCGLPLAKKGAIFQKDGNVYCRYRRRQPHSLARMRERTHARIRRATGLSTTLPRVVVVVAVCVCRNDYLNFFCKRCTACSNHILKHCVSVNDEYYHPECLQCR